MIKDIHRKGRVPRLGCIRLGTKVKGKSGKSYPKEVDYFILDPDTSSKEKNDRLVKEFHDLYGDKPKSINIMFPAGEYFPQHYKRYGSSASLKCIGDGKTAECTKEEYSKVLKVLGKSEKGFTTVECHGKSCVHAKKECSIVGVLHVLLPELPGLGIWQVTTKSFYSIENLNDGIRHIANLCDRTHMIPLVLERKRREIPYEGKMTTHYILGVETSLRLAELQKTAQTVLPQVEVGMPAIDTVEDMCIDTDIPNAKLATRESLLGTEKSDGGKSQESKEDKPEKNAEEGGVALIHDNEQVTTQHDFFGFMIKAKDSLAARTGDNRIYDSGLQYFSVRYLTDVKGNTKKQGDMRTYFTKLISDAEANAVLTKE